MEHVVLCLLVLTNHLLRVSTSADIQLGGLGSGNVDIVTEGGSFVTEDLLALKVRKI